MTESSSVSDITRSSVSARHHLFVLLNNLAVNMQLLVVHVYQTTTAATVYKIRIFIGYSDLHKI